MRSQSTAVFGTLSRLQCLFLVKQGRVKPGITFYQPRGEVRLPHVVRPADYQRRARRLRPHYWYNVTQTVTCLVCF
jgi:hypothetical protein